MTLTRPNSWVSQGPQIAQQAGQVQLTYAMQVHPGPLTVSPTTGSSVIGSVEFIMTNATSKPILIASVAFTIQIGAASSNLTPSTKGIHTSVSDSVNLRVKDPGLVNNGPATYTLEPQTSPTYSLAPGNSISLQLFGFQTVSNPGSTQIAIKEITQTGSGFTNFQVTTFPMGFQFGDLTACVPQGSQLVPVAQVDAGSTVTLTWNGSATDISSYQLFYSDAAKGQQPGKLTQRGEWTSNGLTSDTTFTLIVTVAVEGGAPLSAALTTIVVVRNPDLIAHTLTTLDSVTVGAGISATGPIQTKAGISAVGLITGPGMAPPGAVIMYYGDINNAAHFNSDGRGVTGTPYEDWQLCNGKNGSPDLRNRFIAGAGSSYTVGQTGGADSVTLSNAQMPVHSHGGGTGGSAPQLNYSGVAYNSQGVSSGIMINRGIADPNGMRPNLITTVGWNQIQVNNHGHGINNDGGGQAHENRPQFFALAYIMKLL